MSVETQAFYRQLFVPFPKKDMTEGQRAFNHAMSSYRIAIDWQGNYVVTQIPPNDKQWQSKVFLSAIGASFSIWTVSHIPAYSVSIVPSCIVSTIFKEIIPSIRSQSPTSIYSEMTLLTLRENSSPPRDEGLSKEVVMSNTAVLSCLLNQTSRQEEEKVVEEIQELWRQTGHNVLFIP